MRRPGRHQHGLVLHAGLGLEAFEHAAVYLDLGRGDVQLRPRATAAAGLRQLGECSLLLLGPEGGGRGAQQRAEGGADGALGGAHAGVGEVHRLGGQVVLRGSCQRRRRRRIDHRAAQRQRFLHLRLLFERGTVAGFRVQFGRKESPGEDTRGRGAAGRRPSECGHGAMPRGQQPRVRGGEGQLAPRLRLGLGVPDPGDDGGGGREHLHTFHLVLHGQRQWTRGPVL